MESAPSSAKKQKRSAPISRLRAEERAKQFSVDLYGDDGVLFCRFCEHSIDFTRVDTVKDHIKSKKHTAAKRQKQSGASASRQATLGTVVKSKDMR